ncbi:hypothetical protein V6Z12_D09G088700 [Gossypium hirsutum]
MIYNPSLFQENRVSYESQINSTQKKECREKINEDYESSSSNLLFFLSLLARSFPEKFFHLPPIDSPLP